MTAADIWSSDEHQELEKVLRDVFVTLCPPDLVRQLKEPFSDAKPPHLWRALSDIGVFGFPIDPEFEGVGADLADLSVVFSEGGRVLCPTSVYTNLFFGLALSRLGSDVQKAAYLRAVAQGEILGTTGLWDPVNARVVAPKLAAEREGDGWRLTGELLLVANAVEADVVLVTAQVESFLDCPRVLGFVISPGQPGWFCEPMLTMARDKQGRIVLDGYHVSESDTLAGPKGNGLDPAELHLLADTALALQCAEMVGGASAVLERTVHYVINREQFGRPLARFQAVQHQVADISIALDQARVCTYQALTRLQRGLPAARSVAVAKLHCSDTYKQTTLTAQQLHGAMGIMRETDLHLWSERAKVTEVIGGSADVAAGWLMKELQLA